MCVVKPVIIYITSRGHSGSTLLDLLISAHSQISSVGEVKMLNSHFYAPCTCGADSLATCHFWQKVDQQLQARGYPALKDLDVGSDNQNEFVENNRALYAIVSEQSGSNFIVDSSKNLNRLCSLLNDSSFDIKIIHLIRSPFGVIWSSLKRGRDWRYHSRNYNFAMARTQEQIKNVGHLVVHYEDLAVNTEAVMQRVMKYIGLDFELNQLEWAQHKGHNINGNEMRFSSNSTIRLDKSWQKKLTIMQKLMIYWMSYPSRKNSPELYNRFRDIWEFRSPLLMAGSLLAVFLPYKWEKKLLNILSTHRKS